MISMLPVLKDFASGIGFARTETRFQPTAAWASRTGLAMCHPKRMRGRLPDMINFPQRGWTETGEKLSLCRKAVSPAMSRPTVFVMLRHFLATQRTWRIRTADAEQTDSISRQATISLPTGGPYTIDDNDSAVPRADAQHRWRSFGM